MGIWWWVVGGVLGGLTLAGCVLAAVSLGSVPGYRWLAAVFAVAGFVLPRALGWWGWSVTIGGKRNDPPA
jgi:hypothetical protein